MYRLTTILVLAATFFGLPGCTRAAEDQEADGSGMVRIEQVEVHATLVGAVVLLRVQDKAIPIFVDVFHAATPLLLAEPRLSANSVCTRSQRM